MMDEDLEEKIEQMEAIWESLTLTSEEIQLANIEKKTANTTIMSFSAMDE